MELFDRFRKDTEESALQFDNYPFKLAVIQKLMYGQSLLGAPYRGGDQYFEEYPDFAEVSEEESIRRLEPYIQRANHFFQELKIPSSLAERVRTLCRGGTGCVLPDQPPVDGLRRTL